MRLSELPNKGAVLFGFLVLVAALAMLSVPRSALGQTPTPEKGAADTGLTVTGTAWIDAAPAPPGTTVQAVVNEVVCGEGTVVSNSAPASVALSFSLKAAAASEKAGCGADGATLSFTINGKPANEKLAWDAAAVTAGQAKFIDISAGEPFAAYSGSMAVIGGPLPEGAILDAGVYDPLHPEIEGTVCGKIVFGKDEGLSRAVPSSYAYLVVPPESLKERCGKEGDKILFRVNGCVINNAGWEPGFHRLDLTFEPRLCIPSPTTGDTGGASQPGAIAAPSSGEAAEVGTPEVRVWWAVIAASGLLTLLALGGLAATTRRSRRKA